MKIPQFTGKESLETLLSPHQFLEYIKSVEQKPLNPPPDLMVLCYSYGILQSAKQNYKLEKNSTFPQFVHFFSEKNNTVGLALAQGIGAPMIITMVEEMIAWGVKKFISIGSAGTLQKHIDIGDIVVCDMAIRDEGTSFHYLPGGKLIEATPSLTEKLKKQLNNKKINFHTGTTWTTDAPYRETIAEARHYQSEGVATVEMEASALFALAQYRHVEVAAAFAISDSLADLKWNPQFHHTKTKESLNRLLETCVEIS